MDNNLGNMADSDGSDDEGLTFPDIASLSLNLYRSYLIVVLFNFFFIPPLILVMIPYMLGDEL